MSGKRFREGEGVGTFAANVGAADVGPVVALKKVGRRVGTAVGGRVVGIWVGRAVGNGVVGRAVGRGVGATVGQAVGARVGFTPAEEGEKVGPSIVPKRLYRMYKSYRPW